MHTRVSYAAVGLFVVLLGLVIIAAGLWFSADLSGREYARYSIYSSESVTGLSVNASVRYRGVEVGQVRDIRLDERRPDRVHLLVDIATDTPLRSDTRARLSTQGLTGIAHVELTGGSADAPPPEQPEGERYPVIPTSPSMLSRLDSALDQGLASLDRISVQIESLLQDDNLENLNRALANMEELTRGILGHSNRLDGILDGAENLLHDGSRLSDTLNGQLPLIIDRLDATLSGVDTMSETLADAGDEVARSTRDGSDSLQDLTRATLPQLTALLRELESLSSDMGALTEELAENPSLLLYGRPPRPPGPGEE
ncbi:MAG: MlaD family protein [Aquisalimonadaceae bacterium]